MSLFPWRYTAETLMHLPSSHIGLGAKSLKLFRLEKKHELPQGNLLGKHGARSFCLYYSRKPPIKSRDNIAENATRLLPASGLLGMVLQGTKANNSTNLRCPIARESIVIRLTSRAMQILCQSLYQCLSLNSN